MKVLLDDGVSGWIWIGSVIKNFLQIMPSSERKFILLVSIIPLFRYQSLDHAHLSSKWIIITYYMIDYNYTNTVYTRFLTFTKYFN